MKKTDLKKCSKKVKNRSEKVFFIHQLDFFVGQPSYRCFRLFSLLWQIFLPCFRQKAGKSCSKLLHNLVIIFWKVCSNSFTIIDILPFTQLNRKKLDPIIDLKVVIECFRSNVSSIELRFLLFFRHNIKIIGHFRFKGKCLRHLCLAVNVNYMLTCRKRLQHYPVTISHRLTTVWRHS